MLRRIRIYDQTKIFSISLILSRYSYSLISRSLLLWLQAVTVNLTHHSRIKANLVDVLAADGNFTILLQLIDKAGLLNSLREIDNITIFAPNNDAQRFIKNTLETLSQPPFRPILCYSQLSWFLIESPGGISGSKL